ncbi:MAG: M28 family metallopeptidase [Halieaceae bacterium]|jgi:Zn-dependent M28 family amino/carboxypeptidase/predicted small lipoprotein YifL|nr:M28 family metallopeptidase [Halieaceae bacterium]
MPVTLTRFVVLLMLSSLAACGDRPDLREAAPAEKVNASELSLAALRRSVADDLHTHTAILASDEFGGRAPGTAGESLTIEYLVDEFMALGLTRGNGDSWFQEVPVTSVETSPDVVMSIRGGGGVARDLAYNTEMMVSTQRQLESVTVRDSQLVFVGYGIRAPEQGWDDYAGIDVRGKTVVMLINDPGYATQDPTLFNGNTMTYYGRWTYKYEEAARQGAAAAIIVHQTAPAAYPWEVVSGSWMGPQIGLTAEDQNRELLAAEAWIQESVARELFAIAGLDFKRLSEAAAKPGFEPVPLADLTMSVSLRNTLASTVSNNVVAMLPGTEHPEETVIYSAHWDHLGTIEGADSEDKIFNGASDNATGTAALLSLARLHREAGPAPRSVVFLAVTAEESGLLGSKWYAENPVVPLEKTVANLNMDNLYKNVDGRTRDIAVVGYGNSELEDYLARAADRQDRVLKQEPEPEKGYYYRSDHLNFARKGVPALYLTRSTDSRTYGSEWGLKRLTEYTTRHYHKPSDEYDESWDLTGSAEDVLLLFDVATQLANSRDWPNWREGNEFRALREQSASQRTP